MTHFIPLNLCDAYDFFLIFLNLQITYEEIKDQRSNGFSPQGTQLVSFMELGFNIRTNSKLSTNSSYLFSIYYVQGTALSTF